jgi:hypothetical protein
VADHFINHDFKTDIIDSSTYKKALILLKKQSLDDEVRRREKLLLIRNFLGGLTNLKIIELYKKIKLYEFESSLGYEIDKKEKFLAKNSIQEFEKKLGKYIEKVSA